MLRSLRLRGALSVLIVAAWFSAPAALGSSVPVLGGPYEPDQQGYGYVRPAVIDDGSGGYAYNAIEWFYPEYGQHFEGDQYVNACTGKFHVLPEQPG
jgi:hypothetical protein